MKKDIEAITDIRILVDTFYDTVRRDPLLGPIFDRVIQDRWPEHLEKMYRFWQTLLLGEHTYFSSPFPPHVQLPVKTEHFNTWLGIWRDTVNTYFEGEKAEEAKWRGEKMAAMFLFKIEQYRNYASTPGV